MDEKELREQVTALIEKHKDMEVAMTLTVQELTDVAGLAMIGAGLVKEVPPSVIEFLQGAESVLQQLKDAEDSGQEIVTL